MTLTKSPERTVCVSKTMHVPGVLLYSVEFLTRVSIKAFAFCPINQKPNAKQNLDKCLDLQTMEVPPSNHGVKQQCMHSTKRSNRFPCRQVCRYAENQPRAGGAAAANALQAQQVSSNFKPPEDLQPCLTLDLRRLVKQTLQGRVHFRRAGRIVHAFSERCVRPRYQHPARAQHRRADASRGAQGRRLKPASRHALHQPRNRAEPRAYVRRRSGQHVVYSHARCSAALVYLGMPACDRSCAALAVPQAVLLPSWAGHSADEEPPRSMHSERRDGSC